MKNLRLAVLSLFIALLFVISGCGGGGQSIVVTLSPSTAQSVVAGQTVSLTATVTHDSKNAGVSWTLTGPGALSGQTSTAATYTAPSPIAAAATATVTATSISDSKRTATLTINLQAVSIALTPSSTQTLDQGQTLPVSAAVSNDPQTKGVTWSLSPASGAGTLTGQTAGAVTYNAPASVTAAASAALTATSVFDTTKTTSLTINLVPPPSVTTTSLAAGQVGIAYSASLAATNGVTPYSWSVTSGALPGGLSLNSGSGAITGTPTAAGTFNFTVQVKDAGNLTATANLSITVTVPPLTVTSSSLPAGTVNTAYPNTPLTATGGVSPYTWAVTSGALPPGLSLSTAGVISGTPTTATGSPFSFTVQVTDSATPTANTATANLSITVSTSTCGSGSESMLNGTYVFVLKGFDSSGNPALVGGVLTFNGTGGITAGAVDTNLSGGVFNLTVASGSYSVGSDQRGCMTVNYTAPVQNNFRFSLGNITSGVASTAHVVIFDATGPFTAGRMYKQSGGPFSNSSITGTYVFGGSSIQNSVAAVGGGKFGVVGVINLDGSGGVTGGAEDFNDNGTLDGSASNTTWPASAIPISGGSYSVSSNGRVTLTVAVGGQNFNTVLYLVSLQGIANSSELLFMSADPQTTSHISAGEVFKQSGTPFAANPLSGTYIGYDSGLGSGAAGTTRTDIILLGPLTSGSSTLSGTQLRNDASVFTSSAVSGTYSVSSTGRLLVSGGGGHEPVLYLVSPTQAFFLNGNGGVDSGFFQSQSGGPFSNSTASGTYAYGTIDSEAVGTGFNSGVAAFANPNLTTTEDDNSSGTLTVSSTHSFTYSVDASGLGHIPATCTLGTNCQTLFYIISPTKAVVLDATSTTPAIEIADK